MRAAPRSPTTTTSIASATAAPTRFIVNGEHRFQGVFAQGTYRFTGIPLEVTAGVRGDFWQALNASVLTLNSATNNPVANASASSFDPRIGLKFQATDELALRARGLPQLLRARA